LGLPHISSSSFRLTSRRIASSRPSPLSSSSASSRSGAS
jgi:hypothetical protein